MSSWLRRGVVAAPQVTRITALGDSTSDRLRWGPIPLARIDLPSGYYACAAIGILLAIAMVNAVDLVTVREQWGEDYRFFMAIADRWRIGASVYLPHQLGGRTPSFRDET